jgi:hypothetical protein
MRSGHRSNTHIDFNQQNHNTYQQLVIGVPVAFRGGGAQFQHSTDSISQCRQCFAFDPVPKQKNHANYDADCVSSNLDETSGCLYGQKGVFPHQPFLGCPHF